MYEAWDYKIRKSCLKQTKKNSKPSKESKTKAVKIQTYRSYYQQKKMELVWKNNHKQAAQ